MLKDVAVKIALKKLLGSVLAGGPKAWIIKFIVSELFEEIVEPLIKLSIRKGLLLYDITEGKITIKKITSAKEQGDSDAYRRNVSDV